jgi:tetratricopeptide (TPR) repeat protein
VLFVSFVVQSYSKDPTAMSLRHTLNRSTLLFAFTLSAAATAVADEVVLVANSTVKGAIGGRVRGTIQSESPSEVVVKLGNNTTNVPVGEIASIHYDGQPPSLALAESREAANQLAEAADLYKKAAADAAGKPFIEQAAKFRQAQLVAEIALGDPGRAAEAAALLDAAIKAYPSSRHVVAALDALARLQLQKENFAAVEKTIADMARLPQSADRAAILRARLFDKKGEHDKAIAEYDRLIQGAPDGSVRQREARLAKAESLVGMKKFAEAEADLRNVIKAAPAEDYQAQSAAYNALGDCLRAAGKPKDALNAYLFTDLLYSRDKEQHPRALANLSKLWRELKRDDRADEAYNRLKQEYPQSPWLANARTTGP